MRLRHAAILGTTSCALAACSLFVGLDDLQGGGGMNGDASFVDAAANDGARDGALVDAADASSQDAGNDAAIDIEFVQALAFGYDDAGVGSLDIPRVAPGDTVIVALDVGGTGATVSVSDDQGDTFVPVVGPYDDALLGARSVTFAAVSVPPPGPTQITVATNPSTFAEVYIHEYSGISAFDVGIVAAGSSTAEDGLVSGLVTTSAANELLFAYADSSQHADAGTGFTTRSGFHGNVSEDRIAGAPGSYQATATLSPSGTIGDIMLSCFR